MSDWIDILKPNTANIRIDRKQKYILLIHPHWSKDKSIGLFRQLLKAVKNNSYYGYEVEATGFISLEGLIIASRMQDYFNRLSNVEYTKFNHNFNQGTYSLIVKFKEG